MEEVKLTKEQEILFEVYNKGVQNKDCDLDAYTEKMKQSLSIPDVSQQRELLSQYNNFVNMQYHGVGLDNSDVEDFNDWINIANASGQPK